MNREDIFGLGRAYLGATLLSIWGFYRFPEGILG